MGPAQSHFLKQALYNIEFGLFDHTDPNLVAANPLAVIRAFKEESLQQGSLLDDLVYRWRKNKIYERFKLDFIAYSQLPIPVARKIDDLAISIIKTLDDEEEKLKANYLKDLK